jgi:hypothetical protein
MKDRRKSKRRHLSQYMNVYDVSSGNFIGQLIDITTNGIKLTGEKPVETGQRYKLSMVLPDRTDRDTAIQFKAICIWCEKEYDAQSWQIGLKFTDISAKEIAIIEKSLAGYLL